MNIAGRAIGDSPPCFVIAEAGVNHNGDIDLAKRLIDAAADAGADAVKFQSFKADSIASSGAPKAGYQIQRTGSTGSQLEMLAALELTAADHEDLSRHSTSRDLIFCSTPFDIASVDLLQGLGVPFFKIGSGEITHVPLLRHLGRTGRPIVLSTGMADMDEIEFALATLRGAGAKEIALLHCVSEYPAPSTDANLLAMDVMRTRFGVPVGYSDHTLGLEVAVAASALGASIIEKHLTLDRQLPGPDHSASLEPKEFAELVRQIRSVGASLGDGIKRPQRSELVNRAVVRRGIFAATDIPRGSVLTAEMLACKRPADGIPASEFDAVLGRRANRSIAVGDKLAWEYLD